MSKLTLRRAVTTALYSLIFAAAIPVYLQTASAETAATVTCTDGSTSKSGRGACSHHGGVQKSGAAATTAAPAAEPAPTAAVPAPAAATPAKPAKAAKTTSATDAVTTSGATAKCKDGTVSHSKHHKGACSHHGGVAQWLDGQ